MARDNQDPYTPTKVGGREPLGHQNYRAGYSCVNDPRIHGNVSTKVDATVDVPPDRSELYLLDDGEKKVEIEPETRESPSPPFPHPPNRATH